MESRLDRNGYPALAAWTARNPDYDTFIFRRFDRLSAYNLLVLESQVTALEAGLDQLDEQALRTSVLNPEDLELSRSVRNWEVFAERAKDQSLPEYKRMVILNEISAKLKEYRECINKQDWTWLKLADEAIVLQSTVAAMDKPRNRAFRAVSNFFHGVSSKAYLFEKQRPVLAGRSAGRLDDKQDLIAVRRPSEQDMVSRFLQDNWMFKVSRGLK